MNDYNMIIVSGVFVLLSGIGNFLFMIVDYREHRPARCAMMFTISAYLIRIGITRIIQEDYPDSFFHEPLISLIHSSIMILSVMIAFVEAVQVQRLNQYHSPQKEKEHNGTH